MGRKSNTKKQVRKLVKEKGQKIDKESKKELKKEIKKKVKKSPKKQPPKKTKQSKKELAKKHLQKITAHKQKIFGGALALIMLMILVWVGALIFQKAFRPDPIARYLPADQTIALVEVNINEEHNQFLKTFDLLKDYPNYSFESFVDDFDRAFDLNYEIQIKPWVGRQVGTFFLHSEKDKGESYQYYFAEIFSDTNLNNFLADASRSEYSKENFYSLPLDDSDQAYHFTRMGDYLFMSTEAPAIEELIDYYKSGHDRLYSSSKYRKIDNNLPIGRMLYLYLDFNEMTDSFFQKVPLLSERGASVEALRPILNLFESEGLAMVALDDNIAVESFLTLNSDKVDSGQYLDVRKKYSAHLADYIRDDAIAFWGGEDLETQLKRMLEVITGGDKASVLVFDNLMQNYTQRYFGPDVTFQEDIMPLFKNEFALAIEQSGNDQTYKLILELDDPAGDALKIQEMADSFAQVGGFFEPKIVEHTLKDGSVSREIVALPEEISKSESKYKDTSIHQLKLGDSEEGIFHAVINDIAIISNRRAGVRSTIDIISGENKSLKDTDFFSYNIVPVLRNADGVSYFNFDKLLPVLFDGKEIPKSLEPVASISSGSNYFNDGIKTINYLHIK